MPEVKVNKKKKIKKNFKYLKVFQKKHTHT